MKKAVAPALIIIAILLAACGNSETPATATPGLEIITASAPLATFALPEPTATNLPTVTTATPLTRMTPAVTPAPNLTPEPSGEPTTALNPTAGPSSRPNTATATPGLINSQGCLPGI